MQSNLKAACFLAGTLLTAPVVVNAQASEMDQMRAEMAQMRAEMAQLKSDNQAGWSSDARRAEIEALIADVFADANSRATLLQEGALAGIDEKGKVFLLSADGGFSMNLNGQIQFRYIWNNQDERADESISGFQMRRSKFGAKGKVGDSWGYAIKFAANRDTANVSVNSAKISYKLTDNTTLTAGAGIKLPFARQELVRSSRQVGVDRGLVTEFFTLNKSDGVMMAYKRGDIAFTGALSDGANQNYNDYNNDNSNDFAVTGRLDWMAIGDSWKAAKHEFGGVKEDTLFIGAAAHYEVADKTADPESGFAWTVDALYKTGALGLTAAVFGNHTKATGTADTDQYGVYVQGSVDLENDWDVFARWEYIDGDGNSAVVDDILQAVTFGVNKHFSKNVKFTGDIVYAYSGNDPVADGNTSYDGQDSDALGLGGGFSDDEDTIALRMQLQLLF